MNFCDLQIFKEKYMPVSDSPIGLGAQWTKLVELVVQGDVIWKGAWPTSGGYKLYTRKCPWNSERQRIK